MNTIIEEIRNRIKAAENNIDTAGDYDEYADGRCVGLAAALRIIDEVEKEHPIPSDIQEAADKYAAEQTPVEYPNLYGEDAIKTAYAAGMLAERERLMKKGDDGLEKMIDDFEDWDGSYSRADLPTSYTTRDIARFFANWQRERLEKAAVDGEIVKDIFGKLGVTAKVNLDGFKFGEKVRVIIEEIKEK